MDTVTKSDTSEISKFERIAKLFLLLLNTSNPISLDEIVRQVSGYPKDNKTNQRQMFERDKAELKSGGVEIKIHQIPGNQQYGYTIDTDKQYVTLPDFSPEERVIMSLALSTISIRGVNNHIASIKLGASIQQNHDSDAITIEDAPSLFSIYNSIEKGLLLTFSYAGRKRQIIPGFLQFAEGHWYLHGCQITEEDLLDISEDSAASKKVATTRPLSQDKEEDIGGKINYLLSKRTFRLDKITSLTPGNIKVKRDVLDHVYAVSKGNPQDVTRELHQGDATEITIKISGTDVDILNGWLAHGATITAVDDNCIIIKTFIPNNMKRAVPHLLTFGEKIEITGPKALREEITSYLKTYLDSARHIKNIAGNKDTDGDDMSDRDIETGSFLSKEKKTVVASVKTKIPEKRLGILPESVTKLNTLLCILIYMANKGELKSSPLLNQNCVESSVHLNELSQVFEIDKDTLIKELSAASLIGVPPYGPTDLLEFIIEDDFVKLTLTETFLQLKTPPKLTAEDALLLVTAVKSLAEIENDPKQQTIITSCLSKIENLVNPRHIDIELLLPDEERERVRYLKHLAETQENAIIVYPGNKEDLAKYKDKLNQDSIVADSSVIQKARYMAIARPVKIFQVRLIEGKFYADAYCYLAKDFRRFSVSKIMEIIQPPAGKEVPKGPDQLPDVFYQESAFAPGINSKLATIEVPEEVLHLFDEYLHEKPQTNKNGTYTVKIMVGKPEWLGSLLLGAGPSIIVKSPPDLVDAGVKLAEKLYERYRD